MLLKPRERIQKFEVITNEVVYIMEERQITIPSYPKTEDSGPVVKEENFFDSQVESNSTSIASQTWQERVTLSTVNHFLQDMYHSGVGGLCNIVHIVFWMLDLVIDFICNEYVRNVIVVIVSVALELCVVLVFAIVTIFTAIIINIDECRKLSGSKRKVNKVSEKDISIDAPKTEKICAAILKEQQLKLLSKEVPQVKSMLCDAPSRRSETEREEKEVKFTQIASEVQPIQELEDKTLQIV